MIKQRIVLNNNSSETITVVTDKERFSITQEFKGQLPEHINRYKVMTLNKNEARRLQPILNTWLNGGK